jgi:hypothetical protein
VRPVRLGALPPYPADSRGRFVFTAVPASAKRAPKGNRDRLVSVPRAGTGGPPSPRSEANRDRGKG